MTSSTLIAKSLSRNDYNEALKIFQSTLFISLSVGFVLFLVSIVLIQIISVPSFFKIASFTPIEVNWTIIILIIYVVLSQQQGIFNGVYNYNGKFHFIANVNSASRLIEFVASIIIVIYTKSILCLSIMMLLIKIAHLLFVITDSIKLSPWMKIGINHRDYHFITLQLKPSLSLLLYPISFAILNQGISILIGRSLGSPSLVLFNTLRTLVGSIKTFASQVNNLLFSELIKFFAFNETESAKGFYKKTVINTSLFIAFFGGVLVFFGPMFISKWTGNVLLDIPYTYILFFVLEALTYNLWHANYQTYLAQNRHTNLTIIFFSSSVSIMLLSALFLNVWGVLFFLLVATYIKLFFVFVDSKKALCIAFTNIIKLKSFISEDTSRAFYLKEIARHMFSVLFLAIIFCKICLVFFGDSNDLALTCGIVGICMSLIPILYALNIKQFTLIFS